MSPRIVLVLAAVALLSRSAEASCPTAAQSERVARAIREAGCGQMVYLRFANAGVLVFEDPSFPMEVLTCAESERFALLSEETGYVAVERTQEDLTVPQEAGDLEAFDAAVEPAAARARNRPAPACAAAPTS